MICRVQAKDRGCVRQIDPRTAASTLGDYDTPRGINVQWTGGRSVWREVTFPRRLLMIGPKHTQQGVAWAVAPQTSWKLSEFGAIQLDVDLTASIAATHRRHAVRCRSPSSRTWRRSTACRFWSIFIRKPRLPRSRCMERHGRRYKRPLRSLQDSWRMILIRHFW